MSPRVLVSGAFDDLRLEGVRFLEEASRFGDLHVALWSDAAVEAAAGGPPRFPLEERRYLVEAIRYVRAVSVQEGPPGPGELPFAGAGVPDVWAVTEREPGLEYGETCRARGVRLEVLPEARLCFPPGGEEPPLAPAGPRPRVVVTGCYDWLHSGHIRFFEEVSALGELFVVVGNDGTIRHLKGEGHPLYNAEVRRYMVGSVRSVSRALVSTGWGWLDAEPEIARIAPGVFAVNRDGDRPEKRAFCQARGIRYVVLERTPREGLPARRSTDLRGY